MGSGTKPKPSTAGSDRALRIFGLTGGIASGKSSVARFLAEAGANVIDADQLARDLSREGGRAFPLIVKRFGTADRAKLREIIFNDAAARKDLEKILHPLIGEESRRQMCEMAAKAAGSGPVSFVYEATLLIEAGRLDELQGLIVVEAPETARIKWLRARDACNETAARKILAAQLTDEERRKHADHVLENRGGLDELRVKTLSLGKQLALF